MMKCEVEFIHKDAVEKARKQMIDEDVVLDSAEIFKALSDPARIQILHALSISELCVCDLAKMLDMSVSAISHHLRILRSLRIVKFRKEGKVVFYSLDDVHISSLITSCVEHVMEGREFES